MVRINSTWAIVLTMVGGDSHGANPILTEVLAREGGAVEFVEIWNPGPEPIDLRGWSLSDGSEVDRIGTTADPRATIVGPRRAAVIIGAKDSPPRGTNPAAVVLTVDDRSIGNGLSARDPVFLTDPESGSITSQLTAEEASSLAPPVGVSIERADLDPFNDGGAWAVSRLVGGTPGSLNTRLSAPIALPRDPTWLWSTGDWSIRVARWRASLLKAAEPARLDDLAAIRVDGDQEGLSVLSLRLGPGPGGQVLHLSIWLDRVPTGRHGRSPWTPDHESENVRAPP